jgi:hypothetical protein
VTARIKRIRKLLYGTLGAAAALALLIPPEAPGKLNEFGAVVLALAGLFGVYKATNAPQPSARGLLKERTRATGSAE